MFDFVNATDVLNGYALAFVDEKYAELCSVYYFVDLVDALVAVEP